MAEGTELQPRLPASEDAEVQRWARIGMWLAASEASNPTPQQQGAAAALRLALAQEMGLPMRAASELSIIKGRLVISALLMRGLAHQAGYRVIRVKDSPEAVTAAVVDATGAELGRTTFTMEDAKRAGLIQRGGAWQTYPARMLWARASALAIRDFLPHVALGLITADEAAEITGEIVDVEPEPEPPESQEPPPEPTSGQEVLEHLREPEPPNEAADAAWEASGEQPDHRDDRHPDS